MTDEQYKKLNQLSKKIEALTEDDLLFGNAYEYIQQYFNFIKSNPELNPIAETIINSDLILKGGLGKFYEDKHSATRTPDTIFIKRLNSKLFMALENNQKIVHLSSKKIKINIFIQRNASIIYKNKDTDEEKTYAPKGAYPDWLKIIATLNEKRTILSVKDIAINIGKDGNSKTIQDYIKKQIKYINTKVGKEKLKLNQDLINTTKTTSKNLYRLNEEKYFFVFD